MKNTHLLLAAVLTVTNTQAQSIKGTSSGVFLNPDGPDTAVFSGVGTSAFSWGASTGRLTNSLQLGGAGFHANPGERVVMGNVIYTNAESSSGSEIDSVDAAMTFNLTMPSGQHITQAFTMGIDSTENSSDEEASADSLRLLTPYSASPILDGREVLALRLFFGNAGGNAVGEMEQVILLENHSTSIPLEGVISRTVPLAVNAPGFRFTGYAGGPSVVISGIGSPSISSGTPNPSVYTLSTAVPASPRTEIPFKAGTLSYYNGSVTGDTGAEGAMLEISLGPDLGVHSFPMNFILTTNNGNARESADTVQITQPISPTVIQVQGVPHVVRLSFSNPTTGGFTNVSKFSVEEDSTAQADIVLVVTRFLPEVRPFRLSVAASGNQLLLSWPSVIGGAYQLSASSDGGTFVPDGDQITASNTTTLVTRAILPGRRFFRVEHRP